MTRLQRLRWVVLPFVALALAQTPSIAQESCAPAPTDNSSDTTFGWQPNCGLCITRVVGPGTHSEFAGDGTLQQWSTYVSNDVVSPTAHILFSTGIFTEGVQTGNTQVSFTGQLVVNGHEVGSVSVSLATFDGWGTFCLPVSTKYLKFAQIALAGQTPSAQNGLAGANAVAVNVSSATCTYQGVNGLIVNNQCALTAGAQSVTFDALAPVVMIHGIAVPATGADADWFADFAEPFQASKVPFAKLFFSGNVPIAFGSSKLPSIIVAAANQFGAHHVHIVAHSKGGLWTREFLTHALPANFGVYSVHTLDTPHHGSVGADISLAAHQGASVGFLFGSIPQFLPTGTLVNLFLYDYNAQNDLTVSSVAQYNKNNQLSLPATTTVGQVKNVVHYFAYTGDANRLGPTDGEGFGTINCGWSPCAGYYPWTPAPQMLYKSLQHWQRVQVSLAANGQISSVTATPNSRPYPGNDFVVTVPSAKYEEDKFITVSSLGFTSASATFFVNHHTIGSSAIGAVILKSIIGGLQN